MSHGVRGPARGEGLRHGTKPTARSEGRGGFDRPGPVLPPPRGEVSRHGEWDGTSRVGPDQNGTGGGPAPPLLLLSGPPTVSASTPTSLCTGLVPSLCLSSTVPVSPSLISVRGTVRLWGGVYMCVSTVPGTTGNRRRNPDLLGWIEVWSFVRPERPVREGWDRHRFVVPGTYYDERKRRSRPGALPHWYVG